ncbi:cell division protein FtsQ/DivIB [Pantoea sp. Aalb]|uniref:cell division protein FtsQ/DivIB n=1 Tax=Pantoea sp. Aalb TaxID=2576762 RepID=UPI0013298A6A|nr:cell division protein FtsQ/DivIB [Pantoea sp. Aalb]MXP67189.1 FtsQ-type POTRA domain-containing protein [Pantoea sp. Aalb]
MNLKNNRLFGIICFWFVNIIIIVFILILLKWINDPSRLPISKLLLTGKMHYTTHNDIRQAILSISGNPKTFMSQNIRIIQEHIKHLPWIKKVSIRKQWPDILKIHLVEFIPIAYWNDLYAIDADGILFKIPSNYLNKKEDIPLIYGPKNQEKEVLYDYNIINDVLRKRKYKLKLASTTVSHSWELITSDNLRIELGRSDTINRLKRFIQMYPELQQEANNQHQIISYIDLRYDSGAAVGWYKNH